MSAIAIVKLIKGDFEKPIPNIIEGGEKECMIVSGYNVSSALNAM
jgi:hypothetical protein